MARKTIDVEYMKAWVNTMLMGDDPKMKDFRFGICITIEEMLMKTRNYKGYSLLDYNPDTKEVGDSSRRRYF